MSAHVEEIRLSLGHIELAAHLFGPEDGLPVIALHGWLDNANSFARLAPRLEGLRIIALDMAGHGHSGHRPPGAGYARHRDRFRSDDARVLSLVVYLNPDWPDDAGGQLRLHLPEGAMDIAPRMGTVAIFLSADVDHEVLPATQPRYSVAAWFRQRPRG